MLASSTSNYETFIDDLQSTPKLGAYFSQLLEIVFEINSLREPEFLSISLYQSNELFVLIMFSMINPLFEEKTHNALPSNSQYCVVGNDCLVYLSYTITPPNPN